MGVEIERKFLVADASVIERSDRPPARIRQGYLATGAVSIRVRVTADAARLTVKGPVKGFTRSEHEYDIPREDAEHMLAALCTGHVIEKTRYFITDAGSTWEVDVFDGANAPLLIAEIELADAAQRVDPPAWVGVEVSSDPRYFNAYLAQHPYSTWPETCS